MANNFKESTKMHHFIFRPLIYSPSTSPALQPRTKKKDMKSNNTQRTEVILAPLGPAPPLQQRRGGLLSQKQHYDTIATLFWQCLNFGSSYNCIAFLKTRNKKCASGSDDWRIWGIYQMHNFIVSPSLSPSPTPHSGWLKNENRGWMSTSSGVRYSHLKSSTFQC